MMVIDNNKFQLSVSLSCHRCGKHVTIFCEEGSPNSSKEYGDMLEHIKNDKNCLREMNLKKILNEDK